MEFDVVDPTKEVLLAHIRLGEASPLRYPLILQPMDDSTIPSKLIGYTEEQFVIFDVFYYLLEMALQWEFIASTPYDVSVRRRRSNIWPYGTPMADTFKDVATSNQFLNYAIGRIHKRTHTDGIIITQTNKPAAREFAVSFDRINPNLHTINDEDAWINSARLFTRKDIFHMMTQSLERLLNDPLVMKWYGQLHPFTKPIDNDGPGRVFQIGIPAWLGLGPVLYVTRNSVLLVNRLLSIYVAVLHGGICAGVYAIIVASLIPMEDVSYAYDTKYIPDIESKTQIQIYEEIVKLSQQKVYSETPLILSRDFYLPVPREKIAQSLIFKWSKAFLIDEFNDSLFGIFAMKTFLVYMFSQYNTNRAVRIAFGPTVASRFLSSPSAHKELHKGTIPIISTSETAGYMSGPKFTVEGFPSQLSCLVSFAHLNINEHQEKTRLVAWISHKMGAPTQTFKVSDPHDEFVRRNKTSGVWISDLVDARSLDAANFTIVLDMMKDMTHLPSAKFAEVALCVELYTKTKEPGDHVHMMKRRGVGHVYLTELAWASQNNKPIRLHTWEGPYDSQFSIANDYSTKKTQTHINTSILVLMPQQIIQIDPSVMPDVFSTNEGNKKPEIVISQSGPRHVLSFHKDFVEMYEKNFNRYIIHLNDKHIEKGETMYHSDMLLRVPGSPCPRFVETYQSPPPHSIRYYEELLQMQLRRQALTADEFIIMGSLVYEKIDDFQVRLAQSGRAGKITFGPTISNDERNSVRELAHARFWFIVSQFLSFVQIAKYKLDTLDGVGVECMTDVTSTMRDDCENMATAIINFVRRLNELDFSKYPPLEFLQRVLRWFIPCHTVMTAKSAAMGSSAGQGPQLHMTCLLVPAWSVQKGFNLKDEKMDVEWMKNHAMPHIMEGTGPWAEQTRYYSGLFPKDKTSAFETIYDSTTKYDTIYDTVKHNIPEFIAPVMPVENLKSKQNLSDPIRNHPFFQGFVDIVSRDIQNKDHNLKFIYSDPAHKSEYGIFPPAEKVLCKDENVKVTFEDGDGSWVDLVEDYELYTEKVLTVSEYFCPVPIFDGNDKLAYHQESLLLGSESILVPTITETPPHIYPPESTTDFYTWVAHLLRFRTCVFILPYFDLPNPISAKDKVLESLGLHDSSKEKDRNKLNFITNHSWTVVEPVVGVPVLELIFHY